MPELHWIGKDKVINHHLDVPYHVLERQYSYDKNGKHKADNGSDNMIIHGDNLLALKSLLPKYEGKVDCIYIDPPYNTGNEGWVYNDNVNDPRIKKWLGEVVGKEGEDLTRHDKWLCMMYPRLRLLHRLLAPTGVIFISIDDNEQANLKLICDEIFGAKNFIATIPWRKRTAKSDVPFGISSDCESILSYAKTDAFRAAVESEGRKYFETEDFPGKPWRYHDLTTQRTAEERPNSFFTIVNPKTGEEFPANPLRTWAITYETYDTYAKENRIIFPGDYPFLKIKKPALRYWKEEDQKKDGVFFGYKPASTWLPDAVGMTQHGTQEIQDIFSEKLFNFPKPSSLVKHLISTATWNKPNALILDSFAGSGTTAHAVLNLNKQDGGDRKFILCEMMDYADTITAERVKRVIDGYGEGKKAVEATDGSFSYYELGEPLMVEGNLNQGVSVDRVREYIWYTETGQAFTAPVVEGGPYFLGITNHTAYHFLYDPDQATTLDHRFLSTLTKETVSDQLVVYADACLLSDQELRRFNLTFKKIPRDITRL